MTKRLISAVLACLLLLPFAACGGEADGTFDLSEATLAEIMDEMYARAAESYGFEASMDLELIQKTITPEECSWYFGTEIAFAEALASEYIIMPPAYSVCLVRAQAGDDAAALAETIRLHANPMKWVCTGAGAVAVERIDDLILLVMAEKTNTAALSEAFLSLSNH